jgi:hypothetical protein
MPRVENRKGTALYLCRLKSRAHRQSSDVGRLEPPGRIQQHRHGLQHFLLSLILILRMPNCSSLKTDKSQRKSPIDYLDLDESPTLGADANRQQSLAIAQSSWARMIKTRTKESGREIS